MKPPGTIFSLLLSFMGTFWISTTNGEPVQYCKPGSTNAGDENIDFCMGALMYQNESSNAHDLFLTMTVRRHGGSNLGWTAIGPGTVMDGALMFIIYGDPLSQQDPIISIRTSTGHQQPTLLTQGDMPRGMDLRVIRSSWLPDDTHTPIPTEQHPDNNTYVAWVSLVCYSCHLWHGTDISAQSTSQPWIWAWNSGQEFAVFAFDGELDMHRHHAGAGGWGHFWVDMSRSISTARFPPSLPPIRPGVERLGSSDTPMSFGGSVVEVAVGSGSYIHGLLLATSFLVLFPGGIIALCSNNPKSFPSFTCHWVIQICGSVLLLVGAALGVLKSSSINTLHQWIGIVLATVIGFQVLAGYWHHKLFLRLKRRTWVSYLHTWLGRGLLVLGWGNVVTGLLLRGREPGSALVVILGVVVCALGVGLSWLVFSKERKGGKYMSKLTWAENEDENFALEDGSDSGDEEERKEIEEGRDEMEMTLLQPRDSMSRDNN